ncbi:hypothetical protein, partial [Pararhodobacter aggregans]|uniref:hypothetical protein n=1 Tax=Pararhodobacter aggregans TaxID=404875 RepID=UPI003A932163
RPSPGLWTVKPRHSPPSITEVESPAAWAPVTVVAGRGEWSRVTLGETYGWVRDADLAAARCQQDADIALDARYVPREEATTAYA